MSVPDIGVHGVKAIRILTQRYMLQPSSSQFSVTKIFVDTGEGVVLELRLHHDSGLNIISGQKL